MRCSPELRINRSGSGMPAVSSSAAIAASSIASGCNSPLATLAASASYIAAPTAMRIAVPQANAALSITAALGVTFPFNVLLGIPLYLQLAQYLA